MNLYLRGNPRKTFYMQSQIIRKSVNLNKTSCQWRCCLIAGQDVVLEVEQGTGGQLDPVNGAGVVVGVK